MSPEFDEDRRFELHLRPLVITAIAVALAIPAHEVRPASEEADRKHATDLVASKEGRTYRVATRVRRAHLRERYGHQFTVRDLRLSGARTELSKMRQGWADLMFYGWAKADETRLTAWFLGRMGVFRQWFNHEIGEHDEIPGVTFSNTDRRASQGRAFDIAAMPADFFVMRYPASWGTALTPPRLCPSCAHLHPVGTTCAFGWAPWAP